MLVIQRPTVEPVGDAEDNRQRFAVGPLEPGFGYTLGNSLRRTLLSSIPGSAVTQVRFDDALHEFDTISGVIEDVTDVILNLKDVVLLVHSEEPITLRLDARGPKDVTAADIQPHADVEILNPDLHIATLNGKGRLALDITVGPGPRLRLGRRATRPVADHRHHPGRLDLLADPAGGVHGRADPGRAGHQLRPAGARHRDRRLDHAPGRAGLGRRHPAVAGPAGRGDERRAPGSRARRARSPASAARPTSSCRSRTSTCPSVPATA